MKNLTDVFTLKNGVTIPCIGFGTWQSTGGEAHDSVLCALEAGYRHIDTAGAYGNESEVGCAIADSAIPREEIFITSKLWNTEHTYDKTIRAFENSVRDLKTDYLDLYLIHWPVPKDFRDDWQHANAETWRAFEKLYGDGRIRAIGVSNFLPHHFDALMQSAVTAPMVDQIEFHPGYMQKDVLAYCRSNNILVEAYSPLGLGKMLQNETLQAIAAGYHKSAAQLCLRWALQNGVLPLPKSVTPSRIRENADLFDFEISGRDMDTINHMECFASNGWDPDNLDV